MAGMKTVLKVKVLLRAALTQIMIMFQIIYTFRLHIMLQGRAISYA